MLYTKITEYKILLSVLRNTIPLKYCALVPQKPLFRKGIAVNCITSLQIRNVPSEQR